jgi:hypothetical protein
MKVMLIESVPSGDPDVAEELRARGHEVVRCYEGGDSPFPCLGVTAPERCPLAAGDVPVACVVREFGVFDPTPFEAGVTCALRSRVPVVVESAVLSPFGGHVIDAGAALVTTAEKAASQPLEGHIEVLRTFFATKPILDIDVRRGGGGDLKVTVTVPERAPEWVVQSVMSRTAGVLREYDRYAPRIDVAVKRAS